MNDRHPSPNVSHQQEPMAYRPLITQEQHFYSSSRLCELEPEQARLQLEFRDRCGMSSSHCWIIDDDNQFIKIWRYSSCLLNDEQCLFSSASIYGEVIPEIFPIPSVLRSSPDSLSHSSIFSSKPSDKNESIAFCTASGLVCSLDDTISFQLLALRSEKENVPVAEVSSFTCSVRPTCASNRPIVVTAIGTTGATIIVDIKIDARHYHCEATLFFSLSSNWNDKNNNYPSVPKWNGEVCTSQTQESNINEEVSSRRSWWTSMLTSILPSYRRHNNDEEKEFSSTSLCTDGSSKPRTTRADNIAMDDPNISCHIVCLRGSRYPASSFFPSSSCIELIGATPVGLALFKIEITKGSSNRLSDNAVTLSKKWQTDLVKKLERPGKIVAIGEDADTICVLFSSAATPTTLPSLFAVLLHSENGQVKSYVRLNAAQAVVNAALATPPHLINVFLETKKRKEVAICFRDMVIRINLSPGAQKPCSSSDYTIVLSKHVGSGEPPFFFLTSYILDNGNVVSLGNRGPRWMMRRLWGDNKLDPNAIIRTNISSEPLQCSRMNVEGACGGKLIDSSQLEADASVADLFATCAVNPMVSLDSLILEKGNSFFPSPSLSGTDNLSPPDIGNDPEHTLLGVSSRLKRSQQAHRQFLTSVLRHKTLISAIHHETIGELVSAQEGLLVLTSLRALQNVQCFPSKHEKYSGLFQTINLSYSDPQSAVAVEPPSQGGSDFYSSSVFLLHCQQHVTMSQSILRQCVLQVAQNHKEEMVSHTPLAAAYLVFSHPRFVPELLVAVVQFLEKTWRSVAVTFEDKLLTSYAVSCIFVVVAQTVLESRDDIAKIYLLPLHVRRDFLWTNSSEAVWNIKDAVVCLCRALSDHWAQAYSRLSPFMCQEGQGDVLEHLYFLLFFLFTCQKDSLDAQTFFAQTLRQTLLRSPFVHKPYGYPHGPPRFGLESPSTSPMKGVASFSSTSAAFPFGLRVIKAAESLALGFDVFDVLADFALSVVVDDPTSSVWNSEITSPVAHQNKQPDAAENTLGMSPVSLSSRPYALLVEYCKRNPRFFLFALQYLLSQKREWELVSLPGFLFADLPQAAEQRNLFFEKNAPSLLWITSPTRFDLLLRESIAPRASIPYGPHALAHRSRCVALSRLSYIAAGCPNYSTNFGDLQLSSEIVKAQKKYFFSTSSDEILGAQELVQRLLALQGNIDAWVDAARIALLTRESLSKDLLMQIFRQCKQYDENIFDMCANSVNENEASDLLFRTAVGQVIQNCSSLQSSSLLCSLAGPLYTQKELEFLLSWLDSVLRNKI